MIIENKTKYLLNRFNKISGQYTGILKNFMIYKSGIRDDNNLNIVTGELPQYTKLIVNYSHNMNYHISGYGASFDESIQRFMGESIERYAGVTSHVYNKGVIFNDTYKNAIKKGKSLPINSFNFLKDDQLKKIKSYNNDFWSRGLNEKDVIGWVKVPNLLKDEKVILPASLFFPGYLNDGVFTPAFSTGTACHEDIFRALNSAIIEYIQIDAFINAFYDASDQKEIVFNTLPNDLKEQIKNIMGDSLEKYNLKIIDYSENAVLKLPTVGVYLIAKDNNTFPSITFGVQSDFSPQNAIFRGIQESMAVKEMTSNMLISDPTIFENLKNKEKDSFVDLDSNVAFYADINNYEKNKSDINNRIKIKETYEEFADYNKESSRLVGVKEKLMWLKTMLSKKVSIVGYLDITPPFIEDHNFKVIRVCIPELEHMNFPGYPYKNHSRYKESIKNVFYINPLP